MSVVEFLINRHQFSQEAAFKASLTRVYLKDQRQSDLILSFLKSSGFSNPQIEKVIKNVPCILYYNIDTIKPKIEIFQDLGFLQSDIVEIISTDPWILTRSLDNRLQPSLFVLKKILGSREGMSRILKLSGRLLKHDLEKTMLPNIEYMKNCGISSSQIITYLYNFPRLFLHKPATIMDFVKRIDEMGFDRKSKMFLPAIRTLSSMTLENWELKLKIFRNLGISENDISTLFRKAPQVFTVSESKIKQVTEMVISDANLDISYVLNHPELLIFSFEHRLKPRLEILHTLEQKNVLKRKLSLVTVCRMSKKDFTERYIVPYSNELGKNFAVSEQS